MIRCLWFCVELNWDWAYSHSNLSHFAVAATHVYCPEEPGVIAHDVKSGFPASNVIRCYLDSEIQDAASGPLVVPRRRW